ncbi:MAG: DUF1801 domain-containing protein [Bacteroidota bacterium]|nr:DUF1801 domain-containing protein [Bacteroidota bacterium]
MANTVIDRLRSFVEPYSADFHWRSDGPDGFYTDTTKTDQKGKPEFFASAQVKKNAVSFYLMPVYCFPDLLNGISPELKKRMQGKSCFNFKEVDPRLFNELKTLIERSHKRYRKQGKM